MNCQQSLRSPELPELPAAPEPAGFVPLATCVRVALDSYFRDLEGDPPGNLYELVMAEVERPLLEAVLVHAHSNQSKAARLLGINRSTLRKKLLQHGLESALR